MDIAVIGILSEKRVGEVPGAYVVLVPGIRKPEVKHRRLLYSWKNKSPLTNNSGMES